MEITSMETKNIITEKPEKWLNDYSSSHQILLVGDGNLSFSLCLARTFGSGSNMVSTSLDDKESVVRKYNQAEANLVELEKLGCVLLHGVDATKMKLHTDLKMRKFDRIIFNFPHAGFHGKEDQKRLIRLHRNLVNNFFKNAKSMLRPYGEIHVSHKTGGPFREWKLEELGAKHSLELAECVEFNINDYPGYSQKRGDGGRCDQPFPLGRSSTFKFRIDKTQKKGIPKKEMADTCSFHGIKIPEIPRIEYGNATTFSRDNSLPVRFIPEIPRIRYERTGIDGFVLQTIGVPCENPRILHPYPHMEPSREQTIGVPCENPRILHPYPHMQPSREFLGRVGYSQILRISDESLTNFYDHLKNSQVRWGNVDEALDRILAIGYERYLKQVPGRAGNNYSEYMSELLRVTILRSAWDKGLLVGYTG